MSHSNPSHHTDAILLIGIIILVVGLIIGWDQGTWKGLS